MNEKGITLFETVVSIFLIGVISLFLMNFLTVYNNKSFDLGEHEQAKSLLVKHIENKKIEYKMNNSFEVNNSLVETFKRGDKEYNVYVTLEGVKGNLNDIDSLVKISVKVIWTGHYVEEVLYVSKK